MHLYMHTQITHYLGSLRSARAAPRPHGGLCELLGSPSVLSPHHWHLLPFISHILSSVLVSETELTQSHSFAIVQGFCSVYRADSWSLGLPFKARPHHPCALLFASHSASVLASWHSVPLPCLNPRLSTWHLLCGFSFSPMGFIFPDLLKQVLWMTGLRPAGPGRKPFAPWLTQQFTHLSLIRSGIRESSFCCGLLSCSEHLCFPKLHRTRSAY